VKQDEQGAKQTGLDRLEKARRLVEAALDKKAEDVIALDVRELVSFADTFVIATGSSDRHVRSIVEGLEEALRAVGEKPLGVEGTEEGRWVLIDFDDVIVHVFVRDVRQHYDLERLWSDAPKLTFVGSPAQRTAP
jgi:ribosome-associated protein